MSDELDVEKWDRKTHLTSAEGKRLKWYADQKIAEAKELYEENKKLREALEFYAEYSEGTECIGYCRKFKEGIYKTLGYTARKALETR